MKMMDFRYFWMMYLATDDDERLKQTLGYLERKTDRQIFLFTGRKEILHVLDQNEISYHLISL